MGPRPLLSLLESLTDHLVGVLFVCLYFKLRRLRLELDNAKRERDMESGDESKDVDGSHDGQGSGAEVAEKETIGDIPGNAAQALSGRSQPPAADFEQKHSPDKPSPTASSACRESSESGRGSIDESKDVAESLDSQGSDAASAKKEKVIDCLEVAEPWQVQQPPNAEVAEKEKVPDSLEAAGPGHSKQPPDAKGAEEAKADHSLDEVVGLPQQLQHPPILVTEQKRSVHNGALSVQNSEAKIGVVTNNIAVFEFANLPVELQENILERAVRFCRSRHACKCVSKAWNRLVLELTTETLVKKFESTPHPYNPDEFSSNKSGYHGYHGFYRLANHVFLLVRTSGRRHIGGLHVSFRDAAGKPCTLHHWISVVGTIKLPEARTTFETSFSSKYERNEVSLTCHGLEIRLVTYGRKRQGDLKVVVGKQLEGESSCALCTAQRQSNASNRYLLEHGLFKCWKFF